MKFVHSDLAKGGFRRFSLIEQLSNVGAEVGRAIKWKNKGKLENSRNAFFAALELLYLTIDDPKNKNRLKELTRLYEVLGDYFMGENEFGSTEDNLNNYFLFFNFLARQGK
ncbi:hypothetical protein A2153_01545 [Candidatus Gottesmanbacteria bacterium RBG_16_38_7b]|uniref:Uncharacterized protein n=1 Tax=Candidatus Gottesmanbacteria bacterium RBG_16_38_7b TaxID=1798372 RepID=A0A1F5YF56_9BACT|nr:MAG: hypothetical protein A2153_01545 [Candidatus Gottesmanbacteria bacterium RBG_16_38_7b]